MTTESTGSYDNDSEDHSNNTPTKGNTIEYVIATYNDWIAEQYHTNQLRLQQEKQRLQYNSIHIFCDLDGVLTDFDRGVSNLFNGRQPSNISPKDMWPKLANSKYNFYSSLPWTEDGKLLWSYLMALSAKPPATATAAAAVTSIHSVDFAESTDLEHSFSHLKNDNNNQSIQMNINVTILTGLPRGGWAEKQKREWCERELGQAVHVICCQSKEKCNFIVSSPSPQYSSQNTSPNMTVQETATATSTYSAENRDSHTQSQSGRIRSVLIDDRADARVKWEEKGAIFILHVNAKDTIQQLNRMLGIEDMESADSELTQSG